MRCIYTRNADVCEAECGGSFMCDEHRRLATDHALNRAWAHAREIIITLNETPWDTFICYHCGGEFDRNMICVDHFPRHRGGLRLETMWSIGNLVPSCQACNTSGSPERSKSLRRKTLQPMQQRFVDVRLSLLTGIEELHTTRERLRKDGIRLPPIHEHILIIARALSLKGKPEHG